LVKSISVVTRRAAVSREAFLDYWLEAAAEAVRGIPGSRRSALSYRVADELGDAPYDAFSTVWFDDEKTARAALGDGPPPLAGADAFLERVEHFLANEIVMRDLPTTPEMVKVVFFFHRKPGMSPEAFRRYWLEQHGPLAMKHIAGMRRYHQNHTLDSCYEGGEPAFDGLVEAWLDDVDALNETEASGEHHFVRSDEENFLDLSRVTTMPTYEQLVD
jgi:uncharacterized protein (TIGR02118 family)